MINWSYKIIKWFWFSWVYSEFYLLILVIWENILKAQKTVDREGLNEIWKISVQFFSLYRLLLSSEEPWFLECSTLVHTSISETPFNYLLRVKIIFVLLLPLVSFFINVSFSHALIFGKECFSAIFPGKGYFHPVVLFF